MTNEAFAGIKITKLLKYADWRLTDGVSLRFEYPLDDGGRTECRASGRPQFQLSSAQRPQEGRHHSGIDGSRRYVRRRLPAPRHCHQYAAPTAQVAWLWQRRDDEAMRRFVRPAYRAAVLFSRSNMLKIDETALGSNSRERCAGGSGCR